MDTVKKEMNLLSPAAFWNEMNLWSVYSVKLHTSIPMTNSPNT